MLLSKLLQLCCNVAAPLVKDVHMCFEHGNVRACSICDAQHLLHCVHIGCHRQIAALPDHQLKQLLAGCILRQPYPLLEGYSASQQAHI